jgi:hypothetical protein
MYTRPALLLALLLATSASLASGIYKWVDVDGQVHYSQMPPTDRPSERMKGAAPPANNPDVARSDLQRQMEAFDERRAQRNEEFAEQKHKEEVASIRKQNCETARKNLANLRRGGNNAYMTPEGEVVRLTDDERAKRIEDAKQGIKDNCEG